ncbi:MAG TPA: copper resistance protein CopC [Gaiellales bacterium]|nr:copper resistance protein CopC [Gaiellales bacterium]
MRGIRALAIMLPLLVPAAFPAAALAHASLLRSDPAAGSVVPQAPTQIVLHFDEPVQDAGSAVVSSSGASVLAGRARLEHGDSRALVIPLRGGLGDGDYTVRWRVVSSDGHIVSGVVAIGVGRNRPPPQAATTQTSSLDWPFLAARFAYFLGLMLLVGGAIYRVAVFRPVIAAVTGRPREMAELREGARANSLLLGAAALMLAGGWIALTREGAEVAGVSFWQAFNHHGPIGSALGATRFGREFGRGIDLGAAFCVTTAAAFAVARRSRAGALVLAVPAAALGAWAVIVPGLSGHAGDPGLGLPAVAVDALHTLAAAVWIGGLVQLVLVTPHATRGLPDGERTRVRTAATVRFSKIALASVAVLAATGLGRALWAVSSPAQVWQTGYGRALAVKTCLLAGLVTLGYLNRRRLSAFDAIRRRGALEIGLMMAVLAVVSLLTDLPPANTPGVGSAAPAPAGGPVSLRLSGGARLALWPGFAGTNAVDLRVPGATQPTIDVGTGRTGTVLRRAPDGSYAGLLTALPEGRVRLRIESAPRRLTADVTLGARSGAPPVPAAPAPAGATAAAEASDLAVGGQRVGRRALRLTLLSQTGAAVPDALALVDGHVALPCPGSQDVCYHAPVGAAATPVEVVVRRAGVPDVHATLDLPAEGARPAPGLLRQAAHAFTSLHSLRAENVLASGPGRSVATTYIVQAPNRLVIDVHGGEHSRIIGTTRWDQLASGGWKRSFTPAIHQPDPFWAPTAEAVYVAGGDADTIQLTLVQPGGPTFFRLWVDRRTHIVTRLRMLTAAHFMSERELDLNSAPPVVPPP